MASLFLIFAADRTRRLPSPVMLVLLAHVRSKVPHVEASTRTERRRMSHARVGRQPVFWLLIASYVCLRLFLHVNPVQPAPPARELWFHRCGRDWALFADRSITGRRSIGLLRDRSDLPDCAAGYLATAVAGRRHADTHDASSGIALVHAFRSCSAPAWASRRSSRQPPLLNFWAEPGPMVRSQGHDHASGLRSLRHGARPFISAYQRGRSNPAHPWSCYSLIATGPAFAFGAAFALAVAVAVHRRAVAS